MQLISALPLPLTVLKPVLFTQLPFVVGSVTSNPDLTKPDLDGQIHVLGNRFQGNPGEVYTTAYCLVNHALKPVQYYVWIMEKGAGFWVTASDVKIG